METNLYAIDRIKVALRALFIQEGFKVVHSVYHEMVDELLKDLLEIKNGKPEPPKQKPVVVLNECIQPVAVKLPESIAEPAPEPKKTPTKEENDLKKKTHKDAIAKKREEVKGRGLEPSSLLSLNNMKKWIDDGKTYWWIAEETGNSDLEVSTMAKQFGLQSRVSKMVAFKRGK